MILLDSVFMAAKMMAQIVFEQSPDRTREAIERAVAEVLSLPRFSSLEGPRIVAALEMENNLVYGSAAVLEKREHRPWLYESGVPVNTERLIGWRFWTHHLHHLISLGWPAKVRDNVSDMSIKVLMRLHDPTEPGAWERHGMVVGDVQSGKTANYVGLACRAADAGYKVIVILTGLQDDLRSQTQRRVDRGFIGLDTAAGKAIGVGRLQNHPIVHYGTTANQDFERTAAHGFGFNPMSGDPVVFVVKKNVHILENLKRWVKRRCVGDGQRKARGLPALLIDDECDNASVNIDAVSRGDDGRPLEDYDPSTINGCIRSILDLFEQKAYVGYTATPFASVLIHRDDYSEGLGKDLFPEDFIINLPEASNYVGPKEVFGLEGDPDIDVQPMRGLPLYRVVDDHLAFLSDPHGIDTEPGPLPGTLLSAIHSFVLTCAARQVRGQEKTHNSMLIHVTRFVNVQHAVFEAVREYTLDLSRRLRHGDDSAWETLESLWNRDYVQTSTEMGSLGELSDWDDVRAKVVPALGKIAFRELNGSTADALDYELYQNSGVNLVAVGGTKLSRGLTLEGLSVSYFLRCAKTYDTLMQMGRWFGYRDGYLDLCRIYTTAELMAWYRHIALATIELRQEFDYLVDNHQRPEEYGLKIRSHPGALSVTAFNKLRSATELRVSFHDFMAQTLFLHSDDNVAARNVRAVESLLADTSFSHDSVCYRFEHVAAERVAAFLQEFTTHRRNISCRPDLMVEYIRKLNAEEELVEWTVGVLSRADGEPAKRTIAPIPVPLGLTFRTALRIPPDCVNFEKALLSKDHEKLDLLPNERQILAQKVAAANGRETPRMIRACRASTRGLLLLYPVCGMACGLEYGHGPNPMFGYVLSFPGSGKRRDVKYWVDSLYADEYEARGA
jgi:hypothetical protein